MRSASPASEATVSRLRTLVASGDFPPRSKLPGERDLAAMLDASRPSVREAIRHLIEAGVLRSRPGSGTFVADIDLDEVFEVRLQLEPLAAARAAERASDAQIRELRELAAALVDHTGDAVRFAAIDQQIHRAIAASAGNDVLQTTLARLAELTHVSRSVTATRPPTRRRAARDVDGLVRAIRERRPDAARRAMRKHLVHVRDELRG